MVRLLSLLKAISKALSFALLTVLVTSQVEVPKPLCSESEQKIQTQRAKGKTVPEKISAGKEQIRRLEAKEIKVVQELERLILQLNQSQKLLRKIRRQIQRLRQQIQTSNSQRDTLVKHIHELETYALQRLVAFYKLGQLGIVPILFSTESFFDVWQRRQALTRILEDDDKLWDELQSQQRRIEDLSEKLTAQKLDQDRLLVRLKKEASAVAERRAQRAKLLARIRSQKKLALASMKSLEKTAKEMDAAIRSLEHKAGSLVASIGGKTSTFLALKGSLPKPLPGELVSLFGPCVDESRYNIKGFRSGVNVKADLRSPVHAVCKGQVVYADWFKAYGNIIIIDHGGHYYTLSAQLEELFKNTGDVVETGEVIGTVGDTGTLVGPGLYFEIRHHGKPLDPVVWFRK